MQAFKLPEVLQVLFLITLSLDRGMPDFQMLLPAVSQCVWQPLEVTAEQGVGFMLFYTESGASW